MSIETLIFSRLSGFAGLSSLVSNKIFPVVAQQAVSPPYVVFTLIGHERFTNQVSDSDLRLSHYQFSVFTLSYSSAKSIEAQIIAALDRATFTDGTTTAEDCILENKLELYDDASLLYHNVIDYRIIYRG